MEANVEPPRLQRDVQLWLSTPDPWTSHNVARKTHHNGTATWFTQGTTFNDWKKKSTGSLLWIQGIPGSGKTVLCSTIIEDIWSMRQTASANLAFFYFDHQDAAKLEARSFLSSLLVQLGNQSDRFCEAISTLYMSHDRGSRQPGEDKLMQCLRDMINQGESPVYIIADALDECPDSSPDSSGLASPRAEVLEIIQGLIGISPRVYVCIASRPEMDIRGVLDPLTSHTVSLDKQDGQHQDIAEYIKFVVHSDSRMREWPEVDKKLVIDTLTQDCGGMFQWASCKLKTLRHAPLQSIRRTLSEFPKALDGIYEHSLRSLNEKEREYAHRIFQCLTVSSRPLRVEELAEIFTIEIDAESDAIPEFNSDWRPKDAEEAVLFACSSLVTVVEHDGERTVQFSHPSVQQFLTSNYVANSKDVSNFHILLESAHTFLARVCLSLHLNERKGTGTIHDSPLHSYASKHWVDHARFGNASSIIQEGLERLFDPGRPQFDRDRPRFVAWIRAYDSDRTQESSHTHFALPAPLYYAALCGFYDLAEHLLVTHPQDVNARGGRLMTPLHASIDKGHLKVAQLLLQHGAHLSARDSHDRTPLHLAAECGDPEALRSILDHGANPNAQNKDQETPLFLTSREGRLEAARVLCECRADINHQDSFGRTPLHVATKYGHFDIAHLLIDFGADVNARDEDLRTPLHLAADKGNLAAARLLLERDVDVDARDNMDWSPLHFASRQGHLGIAKFLLEHDADVLARNHEDCTFLDVAWTTGHNDIININARYEGGLTALHIASDPELMRWLINHNVNPSAEDDDQETPLFSASRSGKLEAVWLLLNTGADPNHRDSQGMTPLHVASENGHHSVAKLLLERNADVNARHAYDWTPLHHASRTGENKVAEVLLDSNAEVNAKDDSDWTPLHMASQKGHRVFRSCYSVATLR